MERPNPTAGMRHIALWVSNLAESEQFYVDYLGMSVEWRPDDANVYLTSGNDNLALHQTPSQHKADGDQLLDHIGFILHTPEDVDAWFEFLKAKGVTMKTNPRTHRDGARSFYCLDPAGITVQMIYHPPLV